MTDQASLFDVVDPVAHARSSDPETSKKAARAFKPGTQYAKLILAAGEKHHATSHELGDIAGLRIGIASYWKRVSDLVNMGDLKVTGERICAISGHECQTYALTHQGIWKLSELLKGAK